MYTGSGEQDDSPWQYQTRQLTDQPKKIFLYQSKKWKMDTSGHIWSLNVPVTAVSPSVLLAQGEDKLELPDLAGGVARQRIILSLDPSGDHGTQQPRLSQAERQARVDQGPARPRETLIRAPLRCRSLHDNSGGIRNTVLRVGLDDITYLRLNAQSSQEMTRMVEITLAIRTNKNGLHKPKRRRGLGSGCLSLLLIW